MTNYLKSAIQSPTFNLSSAMIIVGSSVICGKLLTQEIPLFLASEIRLFTLYEPIEYFVS